MIKAAIIVDPELPVGILANAAACISSGLFLNGVELVGPPIEGADVRYLPITKIPILILRADPEKLEIILKKAQELGLKYVAFTKEAQETTDYESYQANVAGKSLSEVTLRGVGVVGEAKLINSLVGSLPMLR